MDLVKFTDAALNSSSNLRQTKWCHYLLSFGRSGASALPCAGAAPPQRPPLASHRAFSSPASCL